jgi:hypothetical protein
MDKDQQRIAIAEACGWSEEDARRGFKTRSVVIDGVRCNQICGQIPDYLNDLNAMHEAEKVIRNKPNKRNGQVYSYVYESILSTLTGGDPIYATAAQRAEAFLKTLNLWAEQ